MAKIVVLAGGKDADAVKAALEAASLDVQIVEPTAGNLLHIVIGMVGDDEPAEEPADEEPAEEAPAEEAPAEEAPTEDETPVEESLGEVKVNGEVIRAVKSKSDRSFLFVESLTSGPKTTYTLNESEFSFWPANVKAPAHRVQVVRGAGAISIEIGVLEGKKTRLEVGADLAYLFTAK